MIVTDRNIDRIARGTLARHGPYAAIAAAERLNACIDRGDWRGRDAWAQIVCRIHQYQRAEPGADRPGQAGGRGTRGIVNRRPR